MRIEHDSGFLTEAPDLGERALEMNARFDVHADHVRSGLGESLEIALGLDDHQVDVDRQTGRAANRSDDDRTERDVRDEATVHHVDVDPVGAGALDGGHLLREAPEIGAQNTRAQFVPPASARS